MAVLIDTPRWPAHGLLWSHLVSDVDLAELHEFAAAQGIPRRGFEGDHYDVPAHRYAAMVAAGARPVSAREILAALESSRLRLTKRRGERGVARVNDVTFPDGTIADIDLIESRRPAEPARVFAAMVFLTDVEGSLAVVHSIRRDQWGSPGGWREGAESVVDNARREVLEETGIRLAGTDLAPVGYERIRAQVRGPLWRSGQDLLQTYAASVATRRPPLATTHGDTSAREWVDWAEYERRCHDQFWWPLAVAALRPVD